MKTQYTSAQNIERKHFFLVCLFQATFIRNIVFWIRGTEKEDIKGGGVNHNTYKKLAAPFQVVVSGHLKPGKAEW